MFSVCTHIWGPFIVLIVDKMLKFKFVHMSCRFLACWTGVKMYDFINLCIGFGDWAALDFYGALRSRTYDRSISKVCYILIEIVRDFLDPFWFFFLSLFVCVCACCFIWLLAQRFRPIEFSWISVKRELFFIWNVVRHYFTLYIQMFYCWHIIYEN